MMCAPVTKKKKKRKQTIRLCMFIIITLPVPGSSWIIGGGRMPSRRAWYDNSRLAQSRANLGHSSVCEPSPNFHVFF